MKKKESKLKGTIVRESVMKNKNSNEKKRVKTKRPQRNKARTIFRKTPQSMRKHNNAQ